MLETDVEKAAIEASDFSNGMKTRAQIIFRIFQKYVKLLITEKHITSHGKNCDFQIIHKNVSFQIEANGQWVFAKVLTVFSVFIKIHSRTKI